MNAWNSVRKKSECPLTMTVVSWSFVWGLSKQKLQKRCIRTRPLSNIFFCPRLPLASRRAVTCRQTSAYLSNAVRCARDEARAHWQTYTYTHTHTHTHTQVHSNRKDGVTIRTGGDPVVRNNVIYGNGGQALAICDGGKGTAEDNDVA